MPVLYQMLQYNVQDTVLVTFVTFVSIIIYIQTIVWDASLEEVCDIVEGRRSVEVMELRLDEVTTVEQFCTCAFLIEMDILFTYTWLHQ
jgi:hypothetical protein